MIDLYTWKTPNGYKIPIMLEEIKLPYKVHAIDISLRDQFKPKYLKINPNNKIPAIVDKDGPGHKALTLFESGAILYYLAEKSGKLLPKNLHERAKVMQWLMFQMSGVGPMLGQAHHFLHYAPKKVPYGIERYTNEAKRLYGVMNKHLAKNKYFADSYSIADIAIYPWIVYHEKQNINLKNYPHVRRWFKMIGERPAVKKGMQIPG